MSKISRKNRIKVTPFLKWVGGKSQLINTIELRFPEEIRSSKVIENYVEPFIGGGALFFYLMSNYDVKKSYISDTNEDLIVAYNVIQKNPIDLIDKLKELKSEFMPLNHEKRKEVYYRVREEFNKSKDNLVYYNCSDEYSEEHTLHAAYLIFLNKTCFNGIYRVNSNGYFNVPMGRYKNPLIFDENNIKNISKVIKKTTIVNGSYRDSYKHITSDSLVYFDPPYRPITETSFTNYTKSSFNDTNQEDLADFYKKVSSKKKGAKLILSNSDPKNRDDSDNFFDDLYSDYKIERVWAKRYVNRDGNNRGPIKEILIMNYDYSS